MALWSYQVVKKSTVQPAIVVSDYSIALLHASCMAFNRHSLQIYLVATFEGRRPAVVLFICCAHVMHAISRDPTIRLKGKMIKSVVMKLVWRLLESRNMDSANEVVKHLFALLKCEFKCDATIEALDFVRNTAGDEEDLQELLDEAGKVTPSSAGMPYASANDRLLVGSPYYAHYKVRNYRFSKSINQICLPPNVYIIIYSITLHFSHLFSILL